MAYDLTSDDLFYVDREGDLYQITYQQIFNREKLQAGDLFLVQRGDRLYQVDIKDLWEHVREIEYDDFLEVERDETLYHVHIAIPPFFAVRVFGYDPDADTNTPGRKAIGLKLAAGPLVSPDEIPKVQLPDGTFQLLTAVETEYEFDQNGIYRFSGDFTNWKITYAQASVDAGLTPGNVWNSMCASSDDLGESMFTNIDVLIAVPDKLKVKSLNQAFEFSGINPDCNITALDTSVVQDASYAFNESFGGCDLTGLNTANVTNMAYMFSKADFYTEDALLWDVRKVTNFASCFLHSTRFNADLSNWDPASALDMSQMFRGSEFNNEVTGSGWSAMGVTNLAYTFAETDNFAQDIDSWRVSACTNFTGTFENAIGFDHDLNNWDVSKGKTFLDTFKNSGFASEVSLWVTAGATVMQGMFTNCGAFNSDITGWDVSGVQDFDQMFQGCENFDQDLGYWDVSDATSMDGMFNNATYFSQDLSYWCVSKIPKEPTAFNTGAGFQDIDAYQPQWGVCPEARKVIFFTWDGTGTLRLSGQYADGVTGKIQSPDGEETGILGSWSRNYTTKPGSYIVDSEGLIKIAFTSSNGNWFFKPLSYTSDLENLTQAFQSCSDFNSDISWWDTSKVTNTWRCFYGASQFRSSVADWDMERVENMSEMFYGCTNFRSDMRKWNVSNVTNMSGMLRGSGSWNSPAMEWDTANVTNMAYMFYQCGRFNQPLAEWDVSLVTNMRSMFQSATQYDNDLSPWCVTNVTDYNYFASSAKFQTMTDKHPQWGTCPPRVVIAPVIAAIDESSLIAPIDSEIIIKADAVTDPVGVATNQWQMKPVGDSLGDWITLPGETGDQYIAQEGDYKIRLLQTITADSGVRKVASNEVRVDIGVFGDFFAFKIDETINGRAFTIRGHVDQPSYIYNPDRLRAVITGDFSSVFNEPGIYLIGSEDLTSVSFQDLPCPFTIDPDSYYEKLTDLSYFAHNCVQFNQDMSWMDTSKVTNMAFMFNKCSSMVQDLSSWDTGSCSNFANAIAGSKIEFGPESWDLSRAEDISYIAYSSYFLGDCSGWDLNRVLYAKAPLQWTSKQSTDITRWSLPKAKDVTQIFYNAQTAYPKGTGANLNFRSVETLEKAFENCNKVDFDSTNWNFSNVIDAQQAFSNLRQGVIFESENWDFSNLANGYQMFYNASVGNIANSGSWTMTSLSNAAQLMKGMKENWDISGWAPTNVNNMYYFAENAYDLRSEVSTWKSSGSVRLDYSFANTILFVGDLHSWCGFANGSNWNNNSGLANQSQLWPQFGKCPPTTLVPLKIRNQTRDDDSGYGEPGDVLVVESYAHTTQSPVDSRTLQWQVVTEGNLAFENVAGATTDTFTLRDGDIKARLWEKYYKDGAYGYSQSNRITDTAPPDEGTFIIVDLLDPPEGQTYSGGKGLRFQGNRTKPGGLIKTPDGRDIEIQQGNFQRIFVEPGRYYLRNDEGLNFVNFFNSQVFFDVSNQSDFSGITNFANLFYNCANCASDVSWIDFSVATDLTYWHYRSNVSYSSPNPVVIKNCSNVYGLYMNANEARKDRLDFSNWDFTQGPTFPNTAALYSGATITQQFLDDSAKFKITNGSSIFQNSSWSASCVFTQVFNVTQCDFSETSSIYYMFGGCKTVGFRLNLPGFDGSNCTNANQFVYSASGPGQIVDIDKWDMSKVQNMYYFAYNFKGLGYGLNETTYDNNVANGAPTIEEGWGGISNWNVSNVKSMYQAFYCCGLFNIDLTGWNTASSTNMYYMFGFAKKFSQDLSGWCVPLCSNTSANYFDKGSGFEGRYDLHPIWGTCPVDVVTDAVIEGENGEWGATGSEVNLVSDVVINPPGESITSQWEYSRKGVVGWSTYGGQMTDVTPLTLQASWDTVRLKQTVKTAFASTVMYSNAVKVDAAFATGGELKFEITEDGGGEAFLTVEIDAHNLTELTEPDGEVIPIRFNAKLSLSKVGVYTLKSNDVTKFNCELAQVDYTYDSSSFTSDLVDLTGFIPAKCTTKDFTWMDTSNVTSMSMVVDHVKCDDIDLTGWDTSNVTNFSTFYRNKGGTLCQGFTGFDFSKATNLTSLFKYKFLTAADLAAINNADFSSATTVQYIFEYAKVHQGANVDLSGIRWNSNPVSFQYAFEYMGAFPVDYDPNNGGTTNRPAQDDNAIIEFKLGKLNTSNCYSIFRDIRNIRFTGLEQWNTSSCTSFYYAFWNCRPLPEGMEGWSTGRATQFNYCFREVYDPNRTLQLNTWDMRNASDLQYMFYSANLADVEIAKWETPKVSNFDYFMQKTQFNPDVSQWYMNNATRIHNMFEGSQPFNADCHRWCVSRIPASSSYTNSWNYNTTQRAYELKQPQWGKCPPRGTGSVVIADTRGTAAELGHTIEILEDFIPDDPEVIKNYQWQRKGEIDLNYSDIPDANEATYVITLDDIKGNIRLVELFGTEDTGISREYSNELYVLDFVTPEGMAVTFGPSVRSGEAVFISIKGSCSQPSTITFEDGTVTNITGDFTVTFDTVGTYFIMSNFLTRLSFENTNTGIFISPQSDMGQFTDASRLFYNTTMFNQDLTWWDTKYLTNMAEMFFYSISFNGNVSTWDTANVTNMAMMFSNAMLFDGDISAWDVSNVQDATSMFSSAYRFNQNLPDWDFSSATELAFMFVSAKNFNGDISNWNVSNATNMYAMFSSAEKFNTSIENWNTINVTNMQQMFSDTQFFNQPLGDWDVSNVTNMAAMFENAVAYQQDLSTWCVDPAPGHEEFARSAKFESQPELQPQWGTCPPPATAAAAAGIPVVLTNPVISEPSN